MSYCIGPPVRETPGFGCGGCARPLSASPRDLRRMAATGRMDCCGYYLDGEHAVRILKAADALEGIDGEATR